MVKEEANIPDTKIVRLHAKVKGRVQGVGFRHFTLTNANDLKLSGWVRNHRDGTVEVLAEGQREKLETLLDALRRGPRSFTTTSVEHDWSQATEEFSRFRVRRTV